MFEQAFKESLQNFIDDLDMAKRLWEDIALHYSGSGRHYHNLSHLDHLTSELLQVKDQVTDWDLVVFAIAYHDIIYDTTGSQNEENSAGHAASTLYPILTSAQVQMVKEAILATKGHQYSPIPGINYFTDADLSILGAPAQQYADYAKQIRGEYAAYPDFIYNQGRRKVLEHFLGMQRIFKTAYFFDKYEEQARINLQLELQMLHS